MSTNWTPIRGRAIAGLLFLACCCHGAGHAGTGLHPGDAAPHIAWATPLAGGPIRAVFIAPEHCASEASELAKRLDLNLAAETVALRSRLAAPVPEGASDEDARAEAGDRLLRALRRQQDLILIGNVDLAILPEAVQARIAAQVLDGSGLLLANHDVPLDGPLRELMDHADPWDDPQALTRGLAESVTPEWTGGPPAVIAATAGAGRIAAIDHGPDRPETQALLPPLVHPFLAYPEFKDVYFSLVVRAAHWAAGRDAPIRVERLDPAGPRGPADEEIPPDLPEAFIEQMRDRARADLVLPYTLRLSAPADRQYTIRVQTRRPGRALSEALLQESTLARGQDALTVHLLAAPGTQLVDIWILGRGGSVIDWHTQAVDMPGWPEFHQLRFSKTQVLANDALDISVHLRPNRGRPRPATLYARAHDPHGRLVAESMLEGAEEGGLVIATLAFADLLSDTIKVEVFLVDGPARPFSSWELSLAAYDYLHVAVRQPEPAPPGGGAPAFRAAGPVAGAIARDAHEYAAQSRLRALAAAGVREIYLPMEGGAPWHGAMAGLRPIAEVAALGAGTWNDGERRPCYSGADFMAREEDRLRESAAAAMMTGAVALSLGLDNAPWHAHRQGCRCDACIVAFQAWLRAEYGAIEALNAAWDLRAGDWREIRPLERFAAEAEGDYGSWIAYERFAAERFNAYHTEAASAVREAIPGARIGVRLDARAQHAGWDWRPLAGALDYIAVDPDAGIADRVRAYRRGPIGGALTIGPDWRDAASIQMRWLPWHAAIRQFTSVWMLDAYGGATREAPGAALDADGRPSPALATLAASAAELHDGPGTLLLNATPEPARIAIADVQLSRLFNQIDPAFPIAESVLAAAWQDALRRKGHAFDWIADEDILSGGLSRYAALILPGVRALSPELARVLLDWKEAGGILVWDLAPRLYTPRGLAPIDGFGEQTLGPGAPAAIEGAEIQPAPDAEPIRLGRVLADADAGPGAAAHIGWQGTPPLWLESRHGAGTSLLLNHLPPPIASPEGAAAFAVLLDQFLGRHGIAPAIPLPHARGRDGSYRLFPGEAASFRFGETRLHVILRDPEGGGRSETVPIPLERGANAFDVLAGLPIRRPHRLQARLGAGEAAMIAVTPETAVNMTLAAPDDAVAGQRLNYQVRLQAQDRKPGQRLVRISLERIGEAPLAHYTRFLICTNGSAEAYVPLALNERPGRHRLRARDILTGAEAAHYVEVVSLLP